MNKTYEMLINDEMLDGVFAISLVDNGAIQEDYVLLSSEDNKMNIEVKLEKIVDKKRKVVCGAALIPDMIIPRNGYNITFSKDTIRKISENFLINNYKDNVTIQHEQNVNKVNLVESWIVDDPKNDKSTMLGMDLAVGTWCVSYKISDDNLWSQFVESGVLKGFSIEGNFSKQEVRMSHDHSNCHHHDPLSEEDAELFEITLAAYNGKFLVDVDELDKKYVWKLGPNEEHCPSCSKYNNKVHTLREWLTIALPREIDGQVIAKDGTATNYPYTRSKGTGRHAPKGSGPVYGTYCESKCGCRLVKEAEEIKKAIVKPDVKSKVKKIYGK